MEVIWIGLCSFLIGLVTFFSGFGFALFMTPLLAWFFPIDYAVSLSGLVHLTTNGFRLSLLRKEINGTLFVRFGIPALIFAALGSWILRQLAWNEPVFTHSWLGTERSIFLLDAVLGGLLLMSAFLTLLPRWSNFSFSSDWITPSGVAAGLLGGLSGTHGAFRALFLVRTQISPATYIATMIWISILADFVRMFRYAETLITETRWEYVDDIVVAVCAAAASALLGKRMLNILSISLLQYIVGFVLLGVGALLCLGFL